MDLTNWWVLNQDTSRPQRMWEAWQQPHRTMVDVALQCLGDVQSVYEVGCGSGPNLRRIKERYPEIKLGGSDPCESLAVWASEHLGVSIDRTALPDVPQDPWDCILSCYTFAYLEPDEAAITFDKLQKVTKHIVLIEPTARCCPFGGPGLYRRGDALPEWAHDFQDLAGPAWRTLWKWPVLPHVDGCNAVTILTREVT